MHLTGKWAAHGSTGHGGTGTGLLGRGALGTGALGTVAQDNRERGHRHGGTGHWARCTDIGIDKGWALGRETKIRKPGSRTVGNRVHPDYGFQESVYRGRPSQKHGTKLLSSG